MAGFWGYGVGGWCGKGAPADFDRVDVRGKIVVVDMLVGGIMPTEGPTYFTYDPMTRSN